ncbi:MAG: MtrAB system histidine kinase MtrB [bacterium]
MTGPRSSSRRTPRADGAALTHQDRWLAGPSRTARLQALPGAITRLWSRSLQIRVAATTLVVTGVFVFVIGVLLVNQISNGVLRAKRAVAVAQANAGLESAQSMLGTISAGDVTGIAPVLRQLSTPNEDTSADSGLYYTSIRAADPTLQRLLATQPEVPDTLRSVVVHGATRTQAIQYAEVRKPGTDTTISALVVGEAVTAPAGSFELYYIFPLTSEQETLALVQRTVLFAGLGLMALIAIIAVLVTRQVVRPMRLVAQTAQRISGGDLSQRVVVRNDDELAVLGRSFNEMAVSLQGQIRRLEELSRLQRRFTSDVSHELRTPLTTVRMATELLHSRREEFPPDVRRSAELLRDELDRFELLLGDLLEISRYDAGVAGLELEPVDVRALVATVVASTNHLAVSQGCEVRVHAPGGPVPAEVDPRRIERVLRNLIGNAIDHSEGRPVDVTVRGRAQAVEVLVRDHGVGLRPGEAGLVFNRFWRGDPSRSRLTGGTGLGLAISLEDARLHGGWLQAWGERGRGALFRLTLPVGPDQPLPAEVPALEPDPNDRDRTDGSAEAASEAALPSADGSRAAVAADASAATGVRAVPVGTS